MAHRAGAFIPTGKFSHTADGRDPGERAQAAGYGYCELAENLAYEQDDSALGEARLTRMFMEGWEASPGHRRNLLDPDVVETGVGVARAASPVHKYVAVQEFGRPVSMRFRFRVDNLTDAPEAYEFDGARRELPPHSTDIETTCVKGDIVFRHVRGGPSRYAAEPGSSYVLSAAPGGVSVEVIRRPRRAGRPDRN